MAVPRSGLLRNGRHSGHILSFKEFGLNKWNRWRQGRGLSLAPLLAALLSPATPAAGLTVTDFRGVRLTFDQPARRIVCLIESGLSGLYMLGVEDRIVGVPASVYRNSVAKQYAALDTRVQKRQLATPGNWDFVSLESMLSLKPDLVILWAAQKESIAALEEKRIPVYGVDIRSFADIDREMADFGDLTGTRQRADALINYTRREISNVVARTQSPAVQPAKAYFMWAQGPLETAGRKSAANELLTLAGARNVCPLPNEHAVVHLESVMTWNPDVIIMWSNPACKPAELLTMDGWRLTAAARRGRVHELTSAFYCDFWTLKYQYAVKQAALWCQPQIMTDTRLDQELRRMLVTLYGQRGLGLLP